MNVLENKIRQLRTALILSKAHALSSKGDYEAASCLIYKIFKIFGDSGPSHATPLVANIFFAGLCENLGRMEAAYNSCEIAVWQITNRSYGSIFQYKDSDIAYLHYICKWTLTGTSKYTDSIAWKLASSIKLTYDMIDISGASATVRRLFPLPPDEGAKFDVYFRQNIAE